jgi:hypothetical protein
MSHKLLPLLVSTTAWRWVYIRLLSAAARNGSNTIDDELHIEY